MYKYNASVCVCVTPRGPHELHQLWWFCTTSQLGFTLQPPAVTTRNTNMFSTGVPYHLSLYTTENCLKVFFGSKRKTTPNCRVPHHQKEMMNFNPNFFECPVCCVFLMGNVFPPGPCVPSRLLQNVFWQLAIDCYVPQLGKGPMVDLPWCWRPAPGSS